MKSGPEGEDSGVRGKRSLCWRDCSTKGRGKMLTGPKKAAGETEPVSAEGNMAILEAKAQARQLRGLGNGYLLRHLFLLLKRGFEGSSARAIHCGVEDSRPKKTAMN